MKKKRGSFYLSLILIFCFLWVIIPAVPAGAADSGELLQIFTRLDTVNGGNWYKSANNDNAQLAWGESYVMDAYLTMYEATGDTVYLDKFIAHGKGVLAQRDSSRGVTDYRSLSLPAWRNGSYTLNGKYAVFAAHTGMIAYPMAKFAAIVTKTPSLQKYRSDRELFLQAAKDAVAVHKDEWVDEGSTGYYKFRDDMPYKQAGGKLPFNQYLAMARTELLIYNATGETQYLDRAKKMLQHFKNNLAVDAGTNSYRWRYSLGSSSYEDIGHAIIDIDAAYQGYAAGVVFNATDMAKFANTGAKKLIKPDGGIANDIMGGGATQYPWFIGLWSAYGQFAPVITDTAYSKLSATTSGGATGLLAAAMLNKANAQPGYRVGESQPSPPVDNPSAGEMVKNGDFSQGKAEWTGPDVVIKTETGGNSYASAKYGWYFYQYVPVEPGNKYAVSARSRKGNAVTEARIAYFFYNAAGKQLSSGSIMYKHKGAGWEQIPAQTVAAPAGAAKIQIKLLVNGGSGTHDFDNISMKKV